MTRIARRLTLLVSVLFLAAVTACGGSDDSNDDSKTDGGIDASDVSETGALDSALRDSASPTDARIEDADRTPDADVDGSTTDASNADGALDAGDDAEIDSGSDAEIDAGPSTVAWISPVANQLFVASGQTQIASATPSTSSNTNGLGIAAPELSLLAPTGGTLVLTVDEANTAPLHTATFATCTITASGAPQTIYVTSPATCSSTAGGADLLVPIDYAQLLAHTFTATFTPTTGATAVATRDVKIDVAEPASVSPTIALKHAIGVGIVTIPTLPGDDQTVGGNPSKWEVRYSTTAITPASWSTATLVDANLAGTFPTGVPTAFQVVLPAGNAIIYLGVRAVDRVGNLGDLGAASVLQLDTQPLGSTLAIVDDSGSAPTSNNDEHMRVVDLDDDGYDDIVLDYPSAHSGDGRIIVYFGGSGALSNPTTPLVLKGSITGGFLGAGTAFDVGDFDADGKLDIAAAEADFSTAHVLIWRGAKIATWKTSGGSAPSPIALSDSAVLVGGAVRAVGHVTGATGVGDDLAVTNYVPGDGSSGPHNVALLARGGTWASSGSTTLFTSGTSPASASISLPADIAGDATATTDSGNLEATTFTYATSGADQVGLALSLVYQDTATPANDEHEARVFAGSAIAAGGNVAWSSGTALPITADVNAHSRFGLYVSGGKDAIGDAHEDLLIANPDNGKLYLYDGAQLLGVQAPTTGLPSITTYDASAESSHAIGDGASLLSDTDGDGKAEIAGATLAATGAQPLYVWFGQTGDAVTPSLPFFPSATCTATATTFCFAPARGQRITTTPIFTGSPLGQAVASGHMTALTSRDLVMLSQGSAAGELVLLH